MLIILETFSAVIGQKAGDTLEELPVHHMADIQRENNTPNTQI